MARDYYEIMGLDSKDKTLNEKDFLAKLKKNYKKLCLKYHPDKNIDKSEEEKKKVEEEFKLVNEANEVLSSQEKRTLYNQFGADYKNIGRQYQPNMNDDFNPFHRRPMRMRGGDVKVTINITLEEVAEGVNKKIKFKRKITCDQCNGLGSTNPNDRKICSICNGTGVETKTYQQGFTTYHEQRTCSHCHGQGYTLKTPCSKCGGTGMADSEETIDINIPKGIDTNMYLTYGGMGHFPPNSVSGDLIAVVNILPHQNFSREGDNLITKVNVSPIEAILGCEKNINTLNGKKIKIKINPNTEYGKKLRLPSHGLPNIQNNSAIGDLIIEVLYKLPDTISEEQKKLLIKFQSLDTKNGNN